MSLGLRTDGLVVTVHQFAAVIAFLAMAVIIIRLRNERNAYRRRAGRKGSAATDPAADVKRKIEFSKLILALVMLTYFIAVAVGVWLSLIDPLQYSTLAMLVGAPTAVGIGFYAWKAKAENVLKYHKDNKDETGDVPFDPGSIT